MMKTCHVLLLLATTYGVVHTTDGRFLHESELLDRLLSGYNPVARPVVNPKDTVYVNISVTLNQLLDLNEKQEVLSSIIWIGATWIDELLTWNETETGIQILGIPVDMIWKPDLSISNLADETISMIEPILGQRESAAVLSNGRIMRYTPLKVGTTCKLNMKDFPYDRHNCSIMIQSWIHNKDQMDLILSRQPTVSDYDGIQMSSAWEVLSITTSSQLISYTENGFVFSQRSFKFTLSLQRKSAFHVAYIVLPSVMLEVIIIVSFLLPIKSGERISLGLTAFLAYSVNILVIADSLPEASDTIPDISINFLFNMGATLLTIIWSVAASRINLDRATYNKPPAWLCQLARYLTSSKTHCRAAIHPRPAQGDKPEHPLEDFHISKIRPLPSEGHDAFKYERRIWKDSSDGESMVDSIDDWCLITKAIDKIFFAIFLVKFIITSIYIVARRKY